MRGHVLAGIAGAVTILLTAQRSGAARHKQHVPQDASDSAATARQHFRVATDRLRVGDSAFALIELDSAMRAWPQQPYYAKAVLQLASLRHDTALINSALQSANAIGWPIDKEVWQPPGQRRGAAALLKIQDSLAHEAVRSTPFRTLDDSALFPETLGFDPRTEMLYVTSVRYGNILQIARDGKTRMLMDVRGAGAIIGMAVDTAHNALWFVRTASPLTDTETRVAPASAELISVRINNGTVARRILFPSGEVTASPGDIALASNGDVFIADAKVGVLWRLKNGGDTLTAIRHRLFHSLQGIVLAKDVTVAWVADYSVGLLRVDLHTGNAVRVADAPGHTTVGIDGLVRYGETLIGVQNGNAPNQVVQLILNATGDRIVRHVVLDRNPLATSPTGGAIIGDRFVYVANSLWDLLDASGHIPATAKLPRPLLLALPMKP